MWKSSEPSVALVFINDKAELEVENAPVLTIPLKELKSTIRKTAKEKPLISGTDQADQRAVCLNKKPVLD